MLAIFRFVEPIKGQSCEAIGASDAPVTGTPCSQITMDWPISQPGQDRSAPTASVGAISKY
jgi:hypothetical protein